MRMRSYLPRTEKKNFRAYSLNGIGHIVSVDKIGFEEIKMKRLRGDLILTSQRSFFFKKKNLDYELQATFTIEVSLSASPYLQGQLFPSSLPRKSSAKCGSRSPRSISLWLPRDWAFRGYSWKPLDSWKRADREITGHPDCSKIVLTLTELHVNVILCTRSQVPIPVQMKWNCQAGRKGTLGRGRSQSCDVGQQSRNGSQHCLSAALGPDPPSFLGTQYHHQQAGTVIPFILPYPG